MKNKKSNTRELTEHNINPKREGLFIAIISLVAMTACLFVLYQRSSDAMRGTIEEALLRDTHFFASMIDGDLHKTFKPGQELSDSYQKAIAPLRAAIKNEKNIKFVYTCVLRDGKVYIILDTTLNEDKDGDGIFEVGLNIMEPYPDASPALLQAITTQKSAVSQDVYTDKWGTFLSGYSPIYDKKGDFIAVVGVDLDGSNYRTHLNRIFYSALLAVVVALLLSMAIGYIVMRLRRQSVEAFAKQTELLKNLIEAREEADRSNQAKSDFLANMTHELRTPMHAILSFSKFGLEDTEKAKEKGGDLKLMEMITGHLTRINESGKRLIGLIDNLLDLSKMESQKQELNKEKKSLKALVNYVTHELQPLAMKKQLMVEADYQDNDWEGVFDYGKIIQVVTNILSNAIKFTSDGGGISIGFNDTTLLNKKKKIAAIEIFVKDEGVGIPDEDIDTVFDQFIQSSRTKTGGGGTGLGLAICREIISLHGGKIWAENNPDGGAVFKFVIPK